MHWLLPEDTEHDFLIEWGLVSCLAKFRPLWTRSCWGVNLWHSHSKDYSLQLLEAKNTLARYMYMQQYMPIIRFLSPSKNVPILSFSTVPKGPCFPFWIPQTGNKSACTPQVENDLLKYCDDLCDLLRSQWCQHSDLYQQPLYHCAVSCHFTVTCLLIHVMRSSVAIGLAYSYLTCELNTCFLVWQHYSVTVRCVYSCVGEYKALILW